MINIAIDAMGGDRAPEVIVKGAERMARTYKDVHLTLYGKRSAIEEHLTQTYSNISIVHTEEVITNEDDPVRAVRRKKNSSMVVAARDVRSGEQDGLFSAGNTGALLSAGTLIVGRMRGVSRPALMATLPLLGPDMAPTVFLDLGANADTKPENINQFAVLGSHFSKVVHGTKQPVVALLNNGTEANKGNKVSQQAYELLENNGDIYFKGNIEARDILHGKADVIVTDGFTGNAVLKTMEGTALSVMSVMKYGIGRAGLTGKMGALLLSGMFKNLKETLDYSHLGGAILVGVKAPVMKTHGATDEKAVFYTLEQMRKVLRSHVIVELSSHFEKRQGQ